MEIRDSEMSLVFFILYICKMKKLMKEKNQVVPDEVLSKDSISQFKTEADVSKFLKQLHAQVLEKMLEGEMDAHLGYEKNSVTGNKHWQLPKWQLSEENSNRTWRVCHFYST